MIVLSTGFFVASFELLLSTRRRGRSEFHVFESICLKRVEKYVNIVQNRRVEIQSRYYDQCYKHELPF